MEEVRSREENQNCDGPIFVRGMRDFSLVDVYRVSMHRLTQHQRKVYYYRVGLRKFIEGDELAAGGLATVPCKPD